MDDIAKRHPPICILFSNAILRTAVRQSNRELIASLSGGITGGCDIACMAQDPSTQTILSILRQFLNHTSPSCRAAYLCQLAHDFTSLLLDLKERQRRSLIALLRQPNPGTRTPMLIAHFIPSPAQPWITERQRTSLIGIPASALIYLRQEGGGVFSNKAIEPGLRRSGQKMLLAGESLRFHFFTVGWHLFTRFTT